MMLITYNLLTLIIVVTGLIGLIWLPGLFLQSLLFRSKISLSESLGLSFALGSGIFVPFSLCCYFFEINLLIAILGYCIGIIALILFFKYAINVPNFKLTFKTVEEYDIAFLVILIILAIQIRNLQYLDRGMGADLWYHLAQVRYLVDAGIVKNVFPSFEPEITQWMYPYNSYYLIIASVAKITNIDVLKVWELTSLVLIFVLSSCAMLFFRVLLEHKWKALVAVALFILPILYLPMESGIGGLTVFRNISYPKVSSFWIFQPLISICILLYIKNKEGRSIFIAGFVICLAFQNWHVVNAMFVVIIGFAWLLGILINRQYHYLKRLAEFSIFISSISIILFYLFDYRIIKAAKIQFDFNTNYLSANYYGAVPILENISKGWYITKASYFFTFGNNEIMPWMLASFLIIPFSLWYLNKNKLANSFLSGFTIAALFLSYNPLTVTIMVKYGAPFLVRRFLFFIPTAQAIALTGLCLLEYLANRMKSENKTYYLKRFFVILLVPIIFFPYVAPAKNRKMLSKTPKYDYWELKDSMRKYIPKGEIVLSDIETSQILNALQWVIVVTAKKHIFKAMNSDYNKKVQDLQLFFSKESGALKRAEIAQNYGANYIIIRRSIIQDIQVKGYIRKFKNDRYEIWVSTKTLEKNKKAINYDDFVKS